MERHPFPNGVVGGSIPVVKSSLYLIEEENNQVGRKPRAHPPQGRILLVQGKTNGLKFTSDSLMLGLFIYLFIFLHPSHATATIGHNDVILYLFPHVINHFFNIDILDDTVASLSCWEFKDEK